MDKDWRDQAPANNISGGSINQAIPSRGMEAHGYIDSIADPSHSTARNRALELQKQIHYLMGRSERAAEYLSLCERYPDVERMIELAKEF